MTITAAIDSKTYTIPAALAADYACGPAVLVLVCGHHLVPENGPSNVGLLGTRKGHVVLRPARDGARLTGRATVEIDHHSPAVLGFGGGGRMAHASAP